MKASVGIATLSLLVVGALSLGASQAQPALVPARSVRDGVYTSVQMARGEVLYNQHCASCHMPDLLGNPTFPSGQPPNPSLGFTGMRSGSPPLRGPEFVSNWSGLSLKDLFFRIRVSMPQNRPGSLSRQQNADILAFMLAQIGYPAGTEELPPLDVGLQNILTLP